MNQKSDPKRKKKKKRSDPRKSLRMWCKELKTENVIEVGIVDNGKKRFSIIIIMHFRRKG